MKKPVIILLALIVSVIGTTKAMPDPSSALRIVPEGAVHTGMAIITSSPANLELNMTNPAHSPITQIWLVFVTNLDTYTNLASGSITTSFSGSWTLYQGDFRLIDDYDGDPEAKEDPIPPPNSTAEGWYFPLPPGYPGCYKDEQYQPDGLREQLGLADADPMYYAYRNITKYLTDNELVYDEVETFTLYVNAPGASDLKVLVLAMGYSAFADNPGEGKLNERSPYSGSTLVVPELSPLILTIASFAALGLYVTKRKKRST